MITDRMSWDEVSNELHEELRAWLDSRKLGKLKHEWNRINMKRTIFPAVYSYDYKSRKNNNCHFILRASERRSLKDKKIQFAFFMDMRTANGNYLVSPCTQRLKYNAGCIIVTTPHAMNRFEQRTGSTKRGMELRKEFMLSVVETGIINNDNPDHISIAFGEGVLLGKMIGEKVCMLKTFIDDRTAREKYKKMKQNSINEMNVLTGRNLTDCQKLIRIMAGELCQYNPLIVRDPFNLNTK